ncbi:MAG TPA: hypothetical protein VJ650_01335 [Gemmatimonadaceae bacterium]|nr:hypothetical protein [Gemmatimonadaceae bacterium]
MTRLVYGLAMLAAVSIAACDDDPTGPPFSALVGTVITPDTIGPQDPIRIVFNRRLDPQTALDPANLVVINQCTGLRVPGALALSVTGDTLTFSPSEPLPFLAVLGIRAQNFLDTTGVGLAEPIAVSILTEPPPVSDVSWELLNSPTDDLVTGVSFVNRTLGYIVARGGAVYLTTDGSLFSALYKNVDLSFTNSIHAFGADTLFITGALRQGTTSSGALMRSNNGGLTFQAVALPRPTITHMSMRREASGDLVALMGGQFASPEVYRWDSGTGTAPLSSGLAVSSQVFTGLDLSPNASNAVVTTAGFGTLAGQGFAYRSTDGGVTFTPVTLPAATFGLRGAVFINNTEALLLGDSSRVIRLNVTTGVATSVGASAGIPQTENDPALGRLTSYQFSRGDFTPGGQIGWIVGAVTRRQTGTPDVVRGVILMTRDGGQTFTRQAITGAPDLGLGFPAVRAIDAMAPDFATLVGASGLVAARTQDIQVVAEACSFVQP